MIKTLPPLHDIAKQAGLDLPEFLGSVTVEDSKNKREEKQKNTDKKSDKNIN
jgi:hypothetical protein